RIRVIPAADNKELIENKKKYPFELFNTIDVKVITTKREFQLAIFGGYTWNGADIPRLFWRAVGSRTDNEFLIASMLHDYLLEFKVYVIDEIFQNQITIPEYRRLTSLIFRHIIKEQGTNTVKANVMAWCVDVFQMLNKGSWKCQ
ncbi:MAG: DUF1353 domain-containing protein, partial [Candidatus Gastranaerophilales bacterium]|nr:DUF1353 domain-containing protein [Candidatus Gastranaerophilales bacterium]